MSVYDTVLIFFDWFVRRRVCHATEQGPRSGADTSSSPESLGHASPADRAAGGLEGSLPRVIVDLGVELTVSAIHRALPHRGKCSMDDRREV